MPDARGKRAFNIWAGEPNCGAAVPELTAWYDHITEHVYGCNAKKLPNLNMCFRSLWSMCFPFLTPSPSLSFLRLLCYLCPWFISIFMSVSLFIFLSDLSLIPGTRCAPILVCLPLARVYSLFTQCSGWVRCKVVLHNSQIHTIGTLFCVTTALSLALALGKLCQSIWWVHEYLSLFWAQVTFEMMCFYYVRL